MAQSHIDLVQIVERAFEEIPAALDAGAKVPCIQPRRADLIPILLGDDPEAIANALLTSLREGTKPADLAGLVVYAAALRLAQFPTSKRIRRLGHRASQFHLCQRRASRTDARRLGRAGARNLRCRDERLPQSFLNVPVAKIPELCGNGHRASDILADLPALFDTQQQVNQVASSVANYFSASADAAPLDAALGKMLLREDRDFHSIQSMEAAFPLAISSRDPIIANHMTIATARYLAAHAPTVRAQGQAFRIAERLHRGDRVFDEA